MRAILASLFSFTAMLIVVGVISENYPDGHWPWWVMPAPILTLLASLFLSMFLFNKRGLRPNLSGKSLQEQIANLDREGLLSRESFRAVRAFALEEFEDEGSHYYIELEDGRVLYLNGQYLYDFEPISDDPDVNQPRKFPCTEFQVLRHKQEGFVIDIECHGEVLEPELIAPHYTKADWKRGVPADGDIILGRSYEEIKAERQGLTHG